MNDDRESVNPDPNENPNDDALESLLRDGLQERAASAAPSGSPDAWQRIAGRRSSSAPSRRRVAVLSLAAAAAIVVLLAGVLATRRGDDARLDTGDGGTTTSSTTAAPGTTGGPGSTVSTAPPGSNPPLEVPDAANATYPATICPEGVRPAVATFTLTDGRWGQPPDEFPIDPSRPISVQLVSSVLADLTGDGQPEAIVQLECVLNHTEGKGSSIAVVDLNGGSATPIASLSGSGTRPMGTFTRVLDDQSAPVTEQRPLDEDVVAFHVDGGRLVVEWRASALGGEDEVLDRRVIVTYVLTGDRFGIVGQPVATSLSRPAGTLLPKQRYAIRTADLRSVRLPLAMAGRDPSQFVCHDFFGASPDEVVDATLVNGEATVMNTSGTPLTDPATGLPRGATVKIDQIFYGDFTGDGPEQAMVVVRCATDVQAYRVPVIFHLVNGQPQVLQVISNPPEWPSALTVEKDTSAPATRLKVVWGFDPTFHPDQPNTMTTHLQWNGSSFDLVNG